MRKLVAVAALIVPFAVPTAAPAQIFIGDSGSLVPASVYVGLTIVTRQWMALFVVMAPQLLNALIKYVSIGVSTRSDYAPLVYRDGLLHLPQRNYLSLIRLYLLTGPKHERQIVHFVYLVQLLFCLLLFLL